MSKLFNTFFLILIPSMLCACCMSPTNASGGAGPVRADKYYSEMYIFHQKQYDGYIEVEAARKALDDNGRPPVYIKNESTTWKEIEEAINHDRTGGTFLKIRTIELFENGKVAVDCGMTDSTDVGVSIYLIRGAQGWVEILRYSYAN